MPVSFPLSSSHPPEVKERPGLLPLSHTLLIPGVGEPWPLMVEGVFLAGLL